MNDGEPVSASELLRRIAELEAALRPFAVAAESAFVAVGATSATAPVPVDKDMKKK